MTLHVMLSLDLSDIDNQRYYFNGYLAENSWEKLNEVDTVWHRTYNYVQNQDNVVADELKKLLKKAAEKFEPSSIEYVAQIGNAAPIKAVWVKTTAGYQHRTR
ncbi:hypothetical protein [Pseudomonas sp. 24 E 1]|uniref:hypothetical protein n=1 Tax=Pseudomonas sp. 24 E 1 TaxID=1844094 RepID=UPI0008125E3F|nr:hypothetical protein [Pseudomonas sp. 24 E 1]CRM05961.1 hypothetical protein [Pseudomonas sp. 24 E 1]